MPMEIPPASRTDPSLIQVGVIFDTPFEKGCKVRTEPDANGEFLGLDSDGVECSFSVRGMPLYIHGVADSKPSKNRGEHA